jgi:hypothetical protein
VEIDDVIDRIVREHEVTPPQTTRLSGGCAELVALDRRIGSVTLFDGAWRLPPFRERRLHWSPDWSITTVIELADGRSICAATDVRRQATHWVVCHAEPVTAAGPVLVYPLEFRMLDDPADVLVYGTSLALLLQAALDSGGDITHLETGRLDQLDPQTN